MKEIKGKNAVALVFTDVNAGTLDESPMVYKPAQEIIDAIGDTVDVIEVIKPVYNFKASDNV